MTNDSQQEKLSKITSEIDDAVDDLFSEFQQVEIDPLTNEVKTVSATGPDQRQPLGMEGPAVAPGLDFLPEEASESIGLGDNSDDLFGRLDHALLTLEWEISPKSIASPRELFARLDQGISPAKPFLSPVFKAIDQVLKAIAESPQLVPTSGPKSLKEALAAIRRIEEQSLTREQATQILAPVLDGLNAALLGDSEATLSGKTAAIIEEAAGLTLAMAGDSGQPEPVMTPEKKENTLDLKLNLGVEEKQAATLASPRPTPAARIPTTADGQTPERLLKVIQANISMLGMCIDRILPLENLFASKPGYDKLHVINKKLREQLELQRDSLSRALRGDYQAFPASLSSPQPAARPAAGQPETQAAPCPWARLTVARWKGTLVAFVPDQVSHVSVRTTPAAKVAHLAKLPLKALKPWPWSSLRQQFQGELAAQPENQLQGLELPVLPHPDVFQALNEPRRDIRILILYSKDSGGVAFVDSGVVEVAVARQWQWEPVDKRTSLLAGHLQAQGQILPVISLI